MKTCNCGSGLASDNVYDAKGIYVTRVCDKCRQEKLSKYRPEIFQDANYWTDEPVDEDY